MISEAVTIVYPQRESDMPAEIRPATSADLPRLVDLLMRDAEIRRAHDPELWALAADAPLKIQQAVSSSLTAPNAPLRQSWHIAEDNGRPVGALHSIRLPVPPIYAGRWGEPGLLMPECIVMPDAPAGTLDTLIEAAEADLRDRGAELLLASFVTGDALRLALTNRGYEPLTLYMSKSRLGGAAGSTHFRAASDEDIDAIVGLSARHRAVIHGLDTFWTPHEDADARFGNWMKSSLTLNDRDMLVTGPPGTPTGYVIAQPASRLHFPAAHDIASIGSIDDFFHGDYADPQIVEGGGQGAASLLAAAEASLAMRGCNTAFIVCPAAWASKRSILESAGYRPAMEWMIRR